MAQICPVCDKKIGFLGGAGEKIGFLDGDFPQEGIEVHIRCMGEFNKDPEKYGGKAKEETENQVQVPSNSKPSDKAFLPTILFCFFLGGLGMHRFFVGKTGTGILMLLTLGGLGIWLIIDLIMIATGSFKDIEGRAITYQSTNTANTATSTHVPEKVVEAPPAKDIPAEIEKLADLKDKGIITDEEFQQKKQELLDRI